MSKAESADLLMKLYDLRREDKMREARVWMFGFQPNSAQEVMGAMVDPKSSAYLRMTISYWDMAASFVNHGAIDEDMFNEVSGEGVLAFSKIHPYLSEIREIMGNPAFLERLEKWVMRMPDAENMLDARRAMVRRMVEASTQAAASQTA